MEDDKNQSAKMTFRQKVHHFIHLLEDSAPWTVIGIFFLFSFSIAIVLFAPRFVDPTWTTPTTPYQAMMYTISDPNLYISSSRRGTEDLEFVHHLKADFTLLSFQESDLEHIVAPPELEQYVTRLG